MHPKTRDRAGFSTSVLCLVISVFAVLPLGLLAFEISRIVLAQDQLQAVSDAAALAGTADLSSEPGSDQSVRQQNAMNVAVGTFCANTIMQSTFNTSQNLKVVFNNNNAQGPPAPPAGIGPNQAWIYIGLQDRNGNYVSTGTFATTMTITSYLGTQPVFASSILPLWGPYVVSAFATGAPPVLDIVVCYDLSGSMDDSTQVYFVRRCWDATNGQVAYVNCNPNGGASDTIYDIENLASLPAPDERMGGSPYPGFGSPDGTPLNIAPPQMLSYAKYYNSSLIFSEDTQSTALNFLRSNYWAYSSGSQTMPEQGLPPGNYDPTPGNSGDTTYQPTVKPQPFPSSNLLANSTYSPSYFTDLINASIVGQSSGGFFFDSIATAVEASRGNLENAAVFKQAVVNPSKWNGAAQPASGWYNAYWNYIYTNPNGMAPMNTSLAAVTQFLTTMYNNTDSHFGLVCFSNRAGTSATDTTGNLGSDSYNSNSVDINYNAGGQSSFRLPMIALNQNQDNYQTCCSALNGTQNGTSFSTYPVCPIAATGMADGMHQATLQLTQNSRSKSRKIMVLFTDGVPNMDPAFEGNGPHMYSTDTEAQAAGRQGIPVYTIGISQNPPVEQLESYVLGLGSGIAGQSGNGATYWLVNSTGTTTSNATNLNQAFAALARSLCSLK